MNLVEFPGLWGLKLNIDRVAFTVFGMPIYWYGIIIAVGFLSAVLLGVKNSKRFGIDPDNIIDAVLFATPAAIIGARLYYVILNWGDYSGNILEVFNTRNGGLAIYGGIIGAMIVGWIFAKKRKIGVMIFMDFCAPYIALGQAIGRWGNFFNQEAFGTNTKLPWGMTSPDIKAYLFDKMEALKASGITVNPDLPVHPTFLYESLWNIAIFAFLIWYRTKSKVQGEVFYLYLILYGIGRFFIEGLRTDSLMIGTLRASQLLSAILVIVFGTLLFIKRRKATEKLDEEIPAGAGSYGSVIEKLRAMDATKNEDNKEVKEIKHEDIEVPVERIEESVDED